MFTSIRKVWPSPPPAWASKPAAKERSEPANAANAAGAVAHGFDFAHVPNRTIQLKTAVGAPGDPLEHEADAVADKVMRMAEPGPIGSGGPAIRRACATCDDAHEIRTKRATSADSLAHLDTGMATRATERGGAPLPAQTRAYFEPRFGHDFSEVRVHAGDEAASAARGLQARAYTWGGHIVFGAGEYAPSTSQGKRLLAHELTHVVQQSSRSGRIAAGGQPQRLFRQPVPMPEGRYPKPPSPPPVFNVFEVPAAATAAGAPAAFDAYIKLGAADQERARKWSHSTGALKKALAALGPTGAADPRYAATVRDILRWIEETETRATTGKSDADMAKTQAGFIKTQAASPPGWGGAAAGATRWAGLLKPAQTAWTDRGNKAIDAMVAYAKTHSPELNLAKSTFELDFDKVDQVSLGALATVGSKPGETVRVGFEFIVTAETNPAYALSTVVHELKGHPIYDKPGESNYAGKIYVEAAKLVPASQNIDRSGHQSFNYWPTEIYSLLKEIPYWTPVTPADAKKKLALPGGSTTSAKDLNYDPRGMISTWLQSIKSNWEPSLVNGMVRGFYKRIVNDPGMQKVSVTEFEKIVKAVFAAPDAAAILK